MPLGSNLLHWLDCCRRCVAGGRFASYKIVGSTPIFQNPKRWYSDCKRNIEMTPLCNIEVTLPRVLGSREVRRGGGVVDEQAGVRPS